MTDEAGIGPSERQVNTLNFQQLCRFQIFDEKPETLSPRERFQLLAVSNKYGYTFVGTNSAAVKIIKTDELVRISDEMHESPGTTVTDYPHERLSVANKPLHIAINCQEQVISVVTRGDTNLKVQIFDIVDVCKQASSAKAFLTTGLSKETDVDLIDLQWNPVTPSLFAACLSDGTAQLWNWADGRLSLVSSLPQVVKANAFCWSPKGKQIVIGTNDGQLMQFTHTMEQKKVVPKPDFTNEAVKVVDILWVSTFMWVVAYIDEEETLQPNLSIVHAPKEQPVSFNNFEDICYGGCEDRKARYYMKFLDKWGFVIASSGTSMETGILGQRPDVKTSWDMWTLEDTARVELPLCGSEDTFPLGFDLDFSSQLPFLAVNKQKLHPVPILLLMSSEGILCPFHVINKAAKESMQQKTEPLPAEGISKGMAVRSSSTDGQPAGIGHQGSINLTPSGTMPSVPKALSQPPTASPFSFNQPTQLASTNQGSFSFGSTTFGGNSSKFTAAGAQLSQPSDEPHTPPTGAQTKPFSFSLPSSTTTSGTPPFSFAKPTASTNARPSFPTFNPPKPLTSQPGPVGTAPQGTAPQGTAPQGIFSPSPGVNAQGIQPQSLLGSAAQANQNQNSGSPFSFTKPAFSFNKPVSTTGKPTAPSQISSSSGGQSSAPGSFSFTKALGNGDKPVAVSRPIVSQVGIGSPMTGTTKAPAKLQETVTTTDHASAYKTTSVAPPNQVAPMMKTLPFSVTEEPQGPSSQITLPKVQDIPKTSGNLSVTIPLEQRKSAMQAQRAATAAAAAAETHKQVYAPVVEPVSPVSSVATSVGGEHLQSALMSNILDEMEHFGKEISDLKSRTRDGKYTVGKKEELRQIRRDMDDLDSFKVDVLECTKSLNEDIHSLKTKLLNSFALLEESKIRKQRNKDPKFITLLKARGLDPQTASKMQNIRGMYHYMDVGSRDVNRSLDMEWEENQRRGTRNGSRKLATPTMDTVYHTLRNHHNIMASQRIALEDIREKLVRAQKYDPIGALYKGPLPSPRFRSDEVEPLALKLSETKLNATRRERHTPASAKRQSLLRDILSRRTQTPMRTSPKVLSREEQVNSPSLSYSSEGSFTPSAPFSKKLDFTDDGGPEPARGNQETRFQQAITPLRESTPVKDTVHKIPSKQDPMPSKQDPMPSKQDMMPPAYPKKAGTQQFGLGTSAVGRVPPTGMAIGTSMPPLKTAPASSMVPLSGLKTAPASSMVPLSGLSQMPPLKTAPASSMVPLSGLSQADVVTTTTSSPFAHTGTGTVLWGADASKATPAQLAGAAALSRIPAKGPGTSGEPTPSKLPPNVNIKNLDSLKSTMPPPVTFAAVASSVDTGTAQVVTQVLSEITATSGKSIPPPGTAVTDTRPVSSSTVEVPTVTSQITQQKFPIDVSLSIAGTKPSAVVAEVTKSGGSLHTPLAASTPLDMVTVTQQSKFDFSGKNNSASSTIPGGFFLGSNVTDKSLGTSAVFGLPKTETTGRTSQSPQTTEPNQKGQPPTTGKGLAVGSTAPPSAPISFSFASSSSKMGFGGSKGGYSFGQFTGQNPDTSSAFGQVSTTKTTQSAVTSAPIASTSTANSAHQTTATLVAQSTSVITTASTPTSEASTTAETEAAGNFVFPVSKAPLDTNPASGSVTGSRPDLFGNAVQTSTPVTEALTTTAAIIPSAGSSTTTSLFGSQSATKPQVTSGFSFEFKEKTTTASPVTESAAATSTFSFVPASTAAVVSSTTAAAGMIASSPFSTANTPTAALPATTTSSSSFSFTPASSGSLFGGSGAGGSLFASSAATTKPSLFGQSTSGFGDTGSSTTTTASGFPFGQSTTTSQSPFGQSTTTSQSPFGQSTTTSQSPFGQSTTTSQSLFGQSASFGQKPVTGFGQTPASSTTASTSLFGTAPSGSAVSGPFGVSTPAATVASGQTSSVESGFGGFGLGGKPNPEAAKINPFGVSDSSAGGTGPFGGNTLFGGQGPKAFGSPTNSGGGGFGGGSFSSGAGVVATGGFCDSQTSTAPAGFGGTPTFGGSAFGSNQAFASPSGFGTGAAFSNPLEQNTFGASPTTGSLFGASSTMTNSPSAGFGGFAAQNTPSFGGIASTSPPGFGAEGTGGAGFAGGAAFGAAQPGNAFGGNAGFGGFSNSPGNGFGNNNTNSSGSFGTGSFSQYR